MLASEVWNSAAVPEKLRCTEAVAVTVDEARAAVPLDLGRLTNLLGSTTEVVERIAAYEHALLDYATPRLVAGDPLSAVTNKCQLKPLNRADDYGPLGLSDAQWATMQTIFPDGVCDFSKPPVGYQPTVAWLTYQKADGKVVYGGEPLPAAASYSGEGWASPAFGVFR